VKGINVYWFVLPLSVAISLVYAASRHESWRRIWRHAARLCLMIVAILIVTTAVLLGVNSLI
jgi:membrane-anchored glycerophosphoryl diester phosphodiesterase (GDPDase)